MTAAIFRSPGLVIPAAFRFNRWRFGILDHPPSRMMTAQGREFSRIHISNSPPCTDTAFRSRRGFSREVYLNFPLSEIRGRRECRAHDAPQPRAPKEKSARA